MSDLKLEDLKVWFCPNGEWVTTYDKSLVPCGALCGETTYGALPEWAQAELVAHGLEGTDNPIIDYELGNEDARRLQTE